MKARPAARTAIGLILAFAFALSPMLVPLSGSAARQVSGNTYTSPQFGYTVTWDSTWFVADESSEEADILELTNGLSYARFVGMEAFSGNAQLAVAIAASSISTDPSVSDLETVEGSQGGDETRAYTTIRYTYTFDDGSTGTLVERFEARTVTPGSSVVIFDGFSNDTVAPVAAAGFDALLAGLVIPGQESTSGGGGGSQTTTTSALEKGEPAPVFMAGPWRIGIVTAVQNPALDGVGLKEKDGKEWVAVVIDVTNWGSEDLTFPVSDFFIQMEGSSTKSKVASGSTATLARELDLPKDPEVEIAVGDTTRLALAFLVKAGRSGPSLVYGAQLFALDQILAFDIDPASLSNPAGPPDLQEATLVSTSDGETIKVQYQDESKSRRVTLLGVDVSETADEAADAIMLFRGETVWLEEDPAIETDSTPAVYLWIEDNDGNRILLNQQLIADGLAVPSSLPEDARFALWLSQSEPVEADQPAESATPEPTSDATPDATPETPSGDTGRDVVTALILAGDRGLAEVFSTALFPANYGQVQDLDLASILLVNRSAQLRELAS